ncbi:MAG TPA: methyl-accepting chemotaxis protein [Myxococcales bacterium LLY-WYZ-16_1]|jgi:methyl-accepting chemotaxis protein|nr:methyl-accepting chemotaxis protein [Myxococcales bacterium LLY-WYZ-16_1]
MSDAPKLSVVEGNEGGPDAMERISESAMSALALSSELGTGFEQAVDSMREAHEEMSDSLGQATRQSTEQVKQMQRVLEVSTSDMDQLSQSSHRVAKTSQLIGQIGAHTKLLALNAHIEASRAGEHGAGFSIVAQEVKSLAVRTEEASVEIQEQVSGMVRRAGAVRSKFDEISQSLASLDALAEQISDALSVQATSVAQLGSELGAFRERVNQLTEDIESIAELAMEG